MKKQNNTMILGVIILLVILLFSGFGMMGFPFGTGMMYGFGFGLLFMILVITALVLFIVWLIKQIQPKKHKKRK